MSGKGTPSSWGTHVPPAGSTHGGGRECGRLAEASMETHTQRHNILPSAPCFPANLGALVSLLLQGLPLG